MRNIRAYAEKPQSKGARAAVIKRLTGYLLQHKFLALLALSLMLVSNLLSLAAPCFREKQSTPFSREKGLWIWIPFGFIVPLC